MEFLFDEAQVGPAVPEDPRQAREPVRPDRGVYDPSFPTRVAALLRSRPIADLASAGSRQDWPDDVYDLPTLALAAIDLVIAQQGLEYEATYHDIASRLQRLSARAAADRPEAEHARVARFVLDGLLNRSARETPFTYLISDYALDEQHRRRQVQFRLLVEREDPVRGEVVLNATGDAINALVGGLEFEVEDEQVANEILLERQLARGAFDAAERAAVRARLLSVGLAQQFHALTQATRRDLTSVLESWSGDVPRALDAAREHIRGRLDVEHRLLVKVRETVGSTEAEIAAASTRIEALLTESRRRHELLHLHVMDARAVFLDEQDRQSFRPPSLGHLPELVDDVFAPLIRLPVNAAADVSAGWMRDVAGPRTPRLPRLYRVIHDLWSFAPETDEHLFAPAVEEVDLAETALIRPEAIAAAAETVEVVGLPARLSTLIAACLAGEGSLADRGQRARIVALAALWCYADETRDGSAEAATQPRADLAVRVFGPRAAVDADHLVLTLPGWAGDDLIIAPDPDSLATADPWPTTALTSSSTPTLGADTC